MAGKPMAAPACQVQRARRGFDLSEEVLLPTAAESRRVGLAGHLRRLEAEAIAIFREVAAEFRNPVLLYSMGKDSSVLLHLARKAFHPAASAVSRTSGTLFASKDLSMDSRPGWSCAPR